MSLFSQAQCSLCPLNASVPIMGYALFAIGQQQVGNIPSIALTIPDFEGFVRLQIFANSTETEIGCFQAVMTNGNSFGHPEAVAPALAVFTAVAIVASLATTMYGVSIPHVRTHYAHSLSVLLIFETFQSIFFSGALSVEWPSALVAWWSNFAWSAGMIYTSAMVQSISPFAGISGNASQVGGAGSTVINNNGGLAGQIYGRSLDLGLEERASLLPLLARDVSDKLVKRKMYNASDPYDYPWGGDPLTPGMPFPGTWNGFAGALSLVQIPQADAFLIGLIWLLVALCTLVVSLVAFKWFLEFLARYTWIREDRLALFRTHYVGYTGLAVLRTLFIAFFMVMTLSIFQFAIHGSTGALAIAAVVFILVLFGMGSLVAYACHFQLRFGRFAVVPDSIVFARTKIFKVVPCILPARSSTLKEQELSERSIGTIPFIRIAFIEDKPSRATIHEDDGYIKRFGWLSARYRRTRWWFFAYYLGYQFVRACFLGGGVGNPLAQVYGLFVYEVVAFMITIWLNPFEGRRNTALGVWMLGISKVVTTGLSIAFLPAFNLNRILTTALGIIIIVVQGFVVIALMILVVIGAISSWMSLTRNREDFEPDYLENIRLRYFEHLQLAAPDDPAALKVKKATKAKKRKGKLQKGGGEKAAEEGLQRPKEPYFSVNSVVRAPKIEDEDGDVVTDINAPHQNAPYHSSLAVDPNRIINRASRTNSVSSRRSVGSLPKGGRSHRTSWNVKDFAQWDASMTSMEHLDTATVLRTRRSNATLGGVREDDTADKAPGGSAASNAPLVIKPQASITSFSTRPPTPQSQTASMTPSRATTPNKPADEATHPSSSHPSSPHPSSPLPSSPHPSSPPPEIQVVPSDP